MLAKKKKNTSTNRTREREREQKMMRGRCGVDHFVKVFILVVVVVMMIWDWEEVEAGGSPFTGQQAYTEMYQKSYQAQVEYAYKIMEEMGIGEHLTEEEKETSRGLYCSEFATLTDPTASVLSLKNNIEQLESNINKLDASNPSHLKFSRRQLEILNFQLHIWEEELSKLPNDSGILNEIQI